MRIRFLTSISGPRLNHKRGDLVNWPDKAEAHRLIDAGMAEPAAADPKNLQADLEEAKAALARSEAALEQARQQLAALGAATANPPAAPAAASTSKESDVNQSKPPAPATKPEQRQQEKKVERADGKPARSKGGKNAGERATLNR